MADDNQNERPIERPPLSERQLANIELDRSCYDSIASAQSTLLDKSIISIAGASFSLSLGFIDKLIPLNKAVAHWMLWVSMLILALSIILTVLSFWAGENCARFMRELCDDAEKECNPGLLYRHNPWKTPLIFFNRSRLVFFIFGIALLAGFIFYNGITGATYGRIATQTTTQSTAPSPQPIQVPLREGMTPLPPRPQGPVAPPKGTPPKK